MLRAAAEVLFIFSYKLVNCPVYFFLYNLQLLCTHGLAKWNVAGSICLIKLCALKRHRGLLSLWQMRGALGTEAPCCVTPHAGRPGAKGSKACARQEEQAMSSYHGQSGAAASAVCVFLVFLLPEFDCMCFQDDGNSICYR